MPLDQPIPALTNPAPDPQCPGGRAHTCAHCGAGAAENDPEQPMRMLRRLAEISMAVAEAVRIQVEAQAAAAQAVLAQIKAAEPGATALQCSAPQPPALQPIFRDPDLALERVARAVRHSLALEAKLRQDRQALADRREAAIEAKQAAQAQEEAAEQRRRGRRRKQEVRNIIDRIVVAEPDTAKASRQRIAVSSHFFDAEDFEFADRPIADIVVQICRHLDIHPDWSRFADEPWAREAASWPPGEPKRPSPDPNRWRNFNIHGR